MNRLPSNSKNGAPKPQVNVQLKLSSEAAALYGSVARENGWSENTIQTLVSAITLSIAQIATELVVAIHGNSSTSDQHVRAAVDIARDAVDRVRMEVPQIVSAILAQQPATPAGPLDVRILEMPPREPLKIEYEYKQTGEVKSAKIKPTT